MSKQSDLKRKMVGLSEEEKMSKIKEIALQEELAKWRGWGLRAVRAKAEGKEIPESPQV